MTNEELLDKLNLQNQRLNELKKENEELKWEQKQILEDNERYQKENEELKKYISKLEDNLVNVTILKDEMKIKELKTQIEKMKCCDNCRLYQCNKWVIGS